HFPYCVYKWKVPRIPVWNCERERWESVVHRRQWLSVEYVHERCLYVVPHTLSRRGARRYYERARREYLVHRIQRSAHRQNSHYIDNADAANARRLYERQ